MNKESNANLRRRLLDVARRFAAMPHIDEPVLSLYLDTAWVDETHQDRVRIFLKNEFSRIKSELAGQRRRERSFQADTKKIESCVFDSLPTDTKGLIIYACHGAGVFHALPLPFAFTPRLLVSDRPYLRPLVRALDEHKSALAVHLHAKKGEILEIALGDVDKTTAIESDVPRRIDRGGWSQMRFQRHVEAHIRDHLHEVAAKLTKIFDQSQIKYVFLFGPEELTNEFKNILPKRLQQVSRLESDPDPGIDVSGLKERVGLLLSQEERKEEEEKITLLRERAPIGEKATLGLEQTLPAVNRSAVRELIISRDYSQSGWECRRCHILGSSLTDRCPECRAPISPTPHLGNAIVAKVLAAGGQIEEIIDNEAFDRLGGIGAFLRF
jgi:peptide chain release factor subunit 1